MKRFPVIKIDLTGSGMAIVPGFGRISLNDARICDKMGAWKVWREGIRQHHYIDL